MLCIGTQLGLFRVKCSGYFCASVLTLPQNLKRGHGKSENDDQNLYVMSFLDNRYL